MKKILKSLVSLMLAIVVVFGVMAPIAPVASALKFSNFYTESDMWLVDSNTHKTSSTIYLYGRADYICLKLKQTDSYKDIFRFKLYSDSKYKEEIMEYSTEYSTVGTKYINIPINFDNLKSGTYYAKTYVYKRCLHGPTGVQLPNSYIPREVDESTIRTYKIKVTKNGTDIDEMSTVMYGFKNTSKGPRVYWYSVPGATGYYLYRKNPSTGKYTKIKTVKDSGEKYTGYTDGTYKGKNATRYYKVIAYKGSLKTPLSPVALKVKALKTPTVKAEMISDNRIKISWSKIASNAEYTVYSRHNDSDSWKKLKTVSGKLSYVDSSQKYENSDNYRFTVVANVSGIDSGYNTTGAALRYLEYPELKACTYPEVGGITVNWKSVVGADSYKIYRKPKSSADWVEIGEVKGGSATKYTDLTANNRDYYYYTVRSMRKGVNGSLDKDGVCATILPQPVLLDISEVDGQNIKINWEKLPNNCEYVVMKKTTEGWKKIATTKENFYIYNMNSQIGSVTFTVKATRGKFTTDFDKTGVTYESYPHVAISDIEANRDGLKLQWKKPVNAENSVVYKKVDDGEYVLIADIAGESLVDTSVDVGVKYSYKIAYKYNGEVIESAAVEQPLCLNTEVVERESTAYNTTLSYSYKSFTTKIKDYDPESTYRVYRATENGWVRMSPQINSVGEITVKNSALGDVESFAIVRITPQGDYTFITEPDFTVEFVSDYIPETLASASVENGYPTIKWDFDSTKKADNIHIYRKAPESKNVYKLVGIVPATQTSFVDESANPNYVFDYQLRVEKDGFVTYGGPVVQVNYMGAPELKIRNLKGRVYIEWEDVSRAKKYLVYRKLPTEDSWTRIGSTTKFYFSDYDAEKYVGYMYMVRAIDEEGNKSPSTVVEEWKYVPSIAEFTAKCESQKNKLTWKPVSGADGYIISYKDYDISKLKWSSTKELVKIKGGTKKSYTDTTISANKVRSYSICAYYEDFEGADNGNKEAGYLSTAKITSFKHLSNGVKVVVEKKTNVEKYLIYRKAPGETKWKEIGEVAPYTRSYIDRTVEAGTKYYYTVKAVYYMDADTPIYSTYNKTGWAITYKP